jgi:prepilin-type N-terminal cleavage/methylation domain-containing protein
MRRYSAGFTIVEVLVALFVASLLSVFVLSLTRSQLVTYEMQSQTISVQQNTRAAFDYVESTLRKACSGLSQGRVRVQLSDATKFDTSCIRVYDGAVVPTVGTPPGPGTPGSFVSGIPTSNADAIEVIYGDGSGLSTVTGIAGNVLTVGDLTPFSHGQRVLVTDMKNGYIFEIDTITVLATGNGKPDQGTISLYLVAGNPSDATIFTIASGASIMPVRSFALYVDTSIDVRNPLLMLDPDGVMGTTHSDAEALAEGVEDLEVAIGWDGALGHPVDGKLDETPGGTADEWFGNDPLSATEISAQALLDATATVWNTSNPTQQGPRLLRLTLILRSINQYPGTTVAIGPAENRSTWAWPTVTAGTARVAPRFRQLRIVVAPRAWNTTE